ncbi:hypothetical protein ACHAXT_007708, partial [Thalassiosira profunda]
TATFAMLMRASIASGDLEKARKYAGQLKSLQEKTGHHSLNGIGKIFSMIEGRMAPEKEQEQSELSIMMEMHESVVEMKGKDSIDAIKIAAQIGTELVNLRRHEESYPWHKEAHDRAKRVFGENNPEYIDIKRKFLLMHSTHGPRKGTLVTTDRKLNGVDITILRATKDGKKYIVEYGEGQKLKVSAAQFVWAADAPVNVNDEGQVFCGYIDSFDSKANVYRVFLMSGVEEHDQYCFVKYPRHKISALFVDPSVLSGVGN